MARTGMCLVFLAMLALHACKSQQASTSTMKGDSAGAPPSSGAGYYKEEPHDGRLYVFGTPAAHDTFEKSKMTPQVAKTYIGSGPSGETVVLEADAKNPELQERLRGEFSRRHSVALQ